MGNLASPERLQGQAEEATAKGVAPGRVVGLGQPRELLDLSPSRSSILIEQDVEVLLGAY